MSGVERTSVSGTRSAPREEAGGAPARINIGMVERGVSVAAGAGLVLWGLGRRSVGGIALAALGGGLIARGLSGHSRLYRLLGLDTAKRREAETQADRSFNAERSTLINRSPEELYRFWRNLENLPRLIEGLESIRVGPGNRSRWLIRAPLGRFLEWDARIRADIPDELFAWESLGPSGLDHEGAVRFQRAPGGGSTEVTFTVTYRPTAGVPGSAITTLYGSHPERTVEEVLRRFQEMMEPEGVDRR